jgi:hypothetical protein
MSTAEITSPRAAELYFNSSLIGHLSAALAENLGSRRQPPAGGRRPAHPRQSAPVAKAAATPPRTLLDRLDAWFWRQEQKSREAYLAASRDVFDLERRIEALNRGTVTPYY